MSNVCEVTGKRRLKGNRVSHANNKKIHFQNPNLQWKTFLVPELGQKVRIKLSTSAIRTVAKFGSLSRYLVNTKAEDLSPRLLRLKKTLVAKGLH